MCLMPPSLDLKCYETEVKCKTNKEQYIYRTMPQYSVNICAI